MQWGVNNVHASQAQAQVQSYIFFSIFYFRTRPDGPSHRTELVFCVDDNLSNFLVDQWSCRRSARRNSIRSTKRIWTVVVSAHCARQPFGWKKVKASLLRLYLLLLLLFIHYWVTIAVEGEYTCCQLVFSTFLCFINNFVEENSWKFNYHFSKPVVSHENETDKTKLETESGADFTCIIISFIFDLFGFFFVPQFAGCCWSFVFVYLVAGAHRMQNGWSVQRK